VTALSYKIQPATLDDISDILRIEEACFSAPWTRKMVEAELRGNPFAHFLIAQELCPGQPRPAPVIGYLCYWIVFEEVRLMNLAVIESKRRAGIAKHLVTAALQQGLAQAAARAVLEVRSSNLAAQNLYAGFGFLRKSLRKLYYTNPVEDAVLMELEPLTLEDKSSPPPITPSGGHVQPLQ
jgi:ribosomal-protein-alanine N-acetyltransferase